MKINPEYVMDVRRYGRGTADKMWGFDPIAQAAAAYKNKQNNKGGKGMTGISYGDLEKAMATAARAMDTDSKNKKGGKVMKGGTVKRYRGIGGTSKELLTSKHPAVVEVRVKAVKSATEMMTRTTEMFAKVAKSLGMSPEDTMTIVYNTMKTKVKGKDWI